MAEVLILHGSPGSGKSTLARAVSEKLRLTDSAHGMIDMDELNLIHPYPGRWFGLANLRAIWPNYASLLGVKVIIPAMIVDAEERELLRAAAPADRFLVCELTAPIATLKDRVTRREPDEFWRSRLRDFVDLYNSRTDLDGLRDFQVSTHDKTVDAAAREVMTNAGWSLPPASG